MLRKDSPLTGKHSPIFNARRLSLSKMSPISQNRKISEPAYESIGFVVTHTSIGNKLGVKYFAKLKAHPMILEINKVGGMEELKRIKAEMKQIIQQNPYTLKWKLYCEFNACMSGQDKMTAVSLLAAFPESRIEKFSLHGLLGGGGQSVTVSEEEEKLGLRAMSAKEALNMLEHTPGEFVELAKQYKEVIPEQKLSFDTQQRRLSVSMEALKISQAALFAQVEKQQLLPANPVVTSGKGSEQIQGTHSPIPGASHQ